MKIEAHERKIARFEKTIAKLDLEDDSETIIEDYMLTAAHFLNAAMHKMGNLPADRDIKHNALFGYIKKENIFKQQSQEIAELISQIEQLRPSYVYGRGEDPKAARTAKEAFGNIKRICKSILSENEN